MKKYFAIFAAVALLGMLAIYFVPNNKKQASAATTSQTTPTQATSMTNSSQSTTTPVSTLQTLATTANTSSLKNGTYNGASVSTRFGTIQIAITVASGSITDVNFISIPDDDMRSYQISSQASPMLESQTISAQSANIDGVSGATYTSNGYIQSLQSAIDAAKS